MNAVDCFQLSDFVYVFEISGLNWINISVEAVPPSKITTSMYEFAVKITY